MTPTFTVLIGSAGRETLRQTLDSIKRQRRVRGDQVVVCFDAFERDTAWLHAQMTFVESYGPGFNALWHDAGYHHYGVPQINAAMRDIPLTGSHVFTLGDDDVFVDGAYETLRPVCEADPLRPVLYRFVAPWRELLWEKKVLTMSRISGCCIAAPLAFVPPMPDKTHWEDGRLYVEHDFHWMETILANAAERLREPRWLTAVLVIARPPQRGEDVAHRGILQCWHCKAWRYLEDVDLRDTRCGHCGVVTDIPGRPVAMLGATA